MLLGPTHNNNRNIYRCAALMPTSVCVLTSTDAQSVWYICFDAAAVWLQQIVCACILLYMHIIAHHVSNAK